METRLGKNNDGFSLSFYKVFRTDGGNKVANHQPPVPVLLNASHTKGKPFE